MTNITYFAGWGPCGALDEPGDFEFFFLIPILSLLLMLVSGILMLRIPLINALDKKSRDSLSTFQQIRLILGLFPRFLAFYFLLYATSEYPNFGGIYAEGVACNPITLPMLGTILCLMVVILYSTKRRLFTKK